MQMETAYGGGPGRAVTSWMPCVGKACKRRTSRHRPQLVRPRPRLVQQACHHPQHFRRLPGRRSQRLHRRFRLLRHWLRRGSLRSHQPQLRRRSKSRHLRPMNSSSLPYISLLVLSCGQNHRLSINLCLYASFCRFSVNLMTRAAACVTELRSTPCAFPKSIHAQVNLLTKWRCTLKPIVLTIALALSAPAAFAADSTSARCYGSSEALSV